MVKGRVTFKIEQVVGDGASKSLPTFSSRLYYEVRSIRHFLGDLHVKRALELGCGYGRLTPWIADFADEMFMVEPERDLAEETVKLYPTFTLASATADKMSFPNKHFGLIVSWTVLQHIPPGKIEQSISEIKRVAEDDATILLAEHTQSTSSPITWGRSIEEYMTLFAPFNLTRHEPRNLEVSLSGFFGDVMKFEKVKT